MKIWTSILVAGAILAFAAPSAFSAGSRLPADPTPAAGVIAKNPTVLVKGTGLADAQARTIKKLKTQNSKLAAKSKKLAAQNASLAKSLQAQADTITYLSARVWELTGPHVTPEYVPDPDADCRDYTVCTDEQLCRLFGERCVLVTPVAPVETAQPEEQS